MNLLNGLLSGTTSSISIPTLDDGTYTTTAINLTNISALTFVNATYSRVGDIVTGTMIWSVRATVSGIETRFEPTTPISVSFTGTDEAVGCGSFQGGNDTAQILSAASSSRLIVRFWPSNTVTRTLTLNFQHLVL